MWGVAVDARTGAYKRHWGRYGMPPDDTFEPGDQPTWVSSPFLVGRPPGMGSTTPRFVHGVNVSRDGLVYASDRSHGMLYVHRKDGTYVTEAKLPGPFNSVAFSPDPGQHYMDTDSQGNLYTCGQRMPQRWTLKGLP